jgi:hypothetical protein
MNIQFPDDAALVLDLARQFVQWLKDEAARTGLNEDEVAAKYGLTFDANDQEMLAFIEKVKRSEVTPVSLKEESSK